MAQTVPLLQGHPQRPTRQIHLLLYKGSGCYDSELVQSGFPMWFVRVLLGRFKLHPGGSRSPAINTKLDTGFMRGIEQRCRRVSMLRLLRLQGQQTSILDTLQIFRLTECQHPRDKVYAPLGLAPVPAKRSIMVDYKQSVADVCLNVVKYLIIDPGHELDFLAYAVKPREPTAHTSSKRPLENLASWISNWGIAMDVCPLPKSFLGVRDDDARVIRPIERRNNPFRNEGLRVSCCHACDDARPTAVIVDTAPQYRRSLLRHYRREIMPLRVQDVAKCP